MPHPSASPTIFFATVKNDGQNCQQADTVRQEKSEQASLKTAKQGSVFLVATVHHPPFRLDKNASPRLSSVFNIIKRAVAQ
ncbi:MAG: hypothetical protein RBR03_05350 [Desulfuromonas thiophila]|jgi:hypothetical protein|nr:hypothetical protein [Desulfuromonas thiophila]MDY0398064.1 hypothetical protein [Desulfuromonas thiophila]